MEGITYSQIHQQVSSWIMRGKVLQEYNDHINYDSYTKFDTYLFTLLGYKAELDKKVMHNTNFIGWHHAYKALEWDVKHGIRNFDWVIGPHGLALFKALLKRNNLG